MFAKPPEHLAISRLETPIGVALLAIDEGGYLRAFDWEDYGNRQVKLLARFNGGALSITEGTAPAAIRQAVAAYFDGDLNALSTIPWRTGGTEFQLKCWKVLCEIPAGSTASYAEQAVKIGKPTAMRAVGLANGCNPVGVIVPCHRVIGANGSITGYGGGLWRKRWLLQHEGATFYDRSGANVATAEAAHALLTAHAESGGADMDATSLVLSLAKQGETAVPDAAE